MYPGACQAHTDVRWKEGNLGSTTFGQATCVVTWATTGACDGYEITLNMGTINAAAQPVDQRSKSACHELGHTVGVRHYGNAGEPNPDGPTGAHSCMRSGEVTSTWTNITLHGPHHKSSHINVTF
jgi:hypothetical protein